MQLQFRFRITSLTFLLLINTLVFILAFIVDNTLGFDKRLFYLFGGEVTTYIKDGSLWLLLTSAFFHINILHFGLNMLSLYRVGEIVLNFYGSRKLFITYILGAIGGSLLSFTMANLSATEVLSLGASGAIFALFALLVGGSLKRYKYGTGLPFRFMDILPLLALSFVIGFVPEFQIDNWDHLGGIITGTILGLIFSNAMSSHLSKFDKNFERVMYYLSIGIFVVAYVFLFVNVYNLILK